MSADTRSSPAEKTWIIRPSATLVARVLGGVLCLAAVLKLVDLFVSPVEGVDLILPLIGSSVELLLGAALLFRIQPAVSVPAAGLQFVLLAGVSLIGTLRAVKTCGCLGMVAMPPWALLVFDVGAAIALLWGPMTSGGMRIKPVLAISAACIGVFLAGMAGGSILYPPQPAGLTATSAEAVATARSVVIDPEQLKGRPFFLLPYIQIDADLSRGEWKIILALPACRLCERRLRGAACRPEGNEQVAVIFAGAKEGGSLPKECDAVVGHLSREKTWAFHAPLIVRLADGRVTDAF
jgi:hypothetical protein